MIRLEKITAGYGETPVLQDVTLQFAPGSLTVLAGPNGSGKSTLLKCAAGLLPVQAGQVLVDDAPLAEYEKDRRQLARKLAYLPQSRPVPGITAKRMVLHGRFPHLGWPRRYRAEDHAAAKRAMEACGIGELAHRPVSALSGGQRQKVYLAMALAQEAPAILLDEPTTHLDIRHRLEILQLARRLADEGKTVVLVLHELDLALRYADKLALLEQGKLIAFDAPRKIAESGLLERVFGVRAEPAGEGYTFHLPE